MSRKCQLLNPNHKEQLIQLTHSQVPETSSEAFRPVSRPPHSRKSYHSTLMTPLWTNVEKTTACFSRFFYFDLRCVQLYCPFIRNSSTTSTGCGTELQQILEVGVWENTKEQWGGPKKNNIFFSYVESRCKICESRCVDR